MNTSAGSPTEVTTTAARDVASGDLHAVPDGRTGMFCGSKTVSSGDSVTLHTCKKVNLVSGAFAEKTAGSLANYDFATQALVVSGGTVIGRYVETKALNALTAIVLLNDQGIAA